MVDRESGRPFQSNPAALRRANAPVPTVSTFSPAAPMMFSSPPVILLSETLLVDDVAAGLPLDTDVVVTGDDARPGQFSC